MSRVFVVQMPLQSDNGELKPRYDVAPAEQYGEIVYLLGPRAAPWSMKPVVEELTDKLQEFSDDDYLLCIGNPIFIGVATAIAVEYNAGRAKMLQWNGKDRKYIPVEVEMIYE